jgi:hypothetical protein
LYESSQNHGNYCCCEKCPPKKSTPPPEAWPKKKHLGFQKLQDMLILTEDQTNLKMYKAKIFHLGRMSCYRAGSQEGPETFFLGVGGCDKVRAHYYKMIMDSGLNSIYKNLSPIGTTQFCPCYNGFKYQHSDC